MRVAELEALVARAFPPELAEPWDKPGLAVGDPSAEVTGVVCALDALPRTVRAARALGCNVLVTHHPAAIEPPFPLTPDPARGGIAGATLFEAARLGVALVAAHTNLDRSEAALDLAAELLALPRTGRLFEPDGYGAVLDASGLSLGELASRARTAFGCVPTVWGDSGRPLETVAFCSGSLGGFGAEALARGISCVVTGEAGYHRVSELTEAGVAAILLGHDASELPYAGLLARTIASEAPDTSIHIIDEGLRWHAWATEE